MHTWQGSHPQVDLAYETYGVRRGALPIIAVNGGPGLSHVYLVQNDLWQRVAQRRLVVLYDQRRTGGSKPLTAGAAQTMEAQVGDLEAIRAALGLEKFALLGDSYGGFLSIAYAAAHPEHVAKLILWDSPGPQMSGVVHLLPQGYRLSSYGAFASARATGSSITSRRFTTTGHLAGSHPVDQFVGISLVCI